MMKEEVILVNSKDEEVGVMEKMEAHEKALLHRAVSVFILNSKGEWLLQRRAFEKYHSGGLWTNTCCTHPKPNEKANVAAQRRLMEEMGMHVGISKVFDFIYKENLDNDLVEHELDHVFVGKTDNFPEINKDEVSEWKYIRFEDLDNDVKLNPENYTVWFRKIYRDVNSKISNA